MKWLKYEENDNFAIAIYNYQPSHAQHMELRIGDFLCIREHYPGWFRGFKYTQPCVLKVFPSSHIKLLSNEIYPDIWAEIFSWIYNIHRSYLDTDAKEFDQISESFQLTLAEKRFDNNMEKIRMPEFNKKAVIQKMEITRKLLGLPIESRNEKGEKVDLKNISVLDLYEQHKREQDSSRNVSNQYDSTVDNISIYLKMLRINFEKPQIPDENIDINISLYKLEDKKICRISETYSHRVSMRMNECDLLRANAIVTKDIQFIPNHRTFLVFQFIRIGQMVLGAKLKKDEPFYRRPKGVSVLEITNSIIENHESERQVGIQLISKEESLESVTEQLINDYRVSRREYRSVINILLKVIRPDESNDRNIVLLGMNPYYPPPIRNKRNCLYLTLYRADIERGRKKTDPNIEVEISVCDHTGNEISLPSSDWRKFDKYKSVIYYHTGKPRWGEVIYIPLLSKNENMSPYTHIRFLIFHRSLNDNSKSPLGVAYLKLFPGNNNAILVNKDHDNLHALSIHKLEMSKIQKTEYLCLPQFDNPDNSFPSSRTLNRRRPVSPKDVLYVQTLLCSTEYTFDELLANVCCGATLDSTILHQLETETILVKNIDVNELKKFAVKILEASLNLLQKATNTNYLGSNILLLLGEMFKAIQNLPEYQLALNTFINETMHFNVHKQILHELISHVPQTGSNILRESDWFMKIIVKSFQNYEEQFGNDDKTNVFNDLVDKYLQKLESFANKDENKLLRSIVLKGAGPIINALIPVCQPIGMAKLVNNLLVNCKDLDANTKSLLTMDCMNSKLFIDPQCRKIILPETTKNILELFNIQLNKIIQGQDVEQDHMLDNICDKMLTFMQLHEQSWKRASLEDVDNLVYELIIEHNLFRSCVCMICNGLEFLTRENVNNKLLQKPLMILVSVVITCLSYLTDRLWERISKDKNDICSACESIRMTNNYDMVSELFCLITELQNNPVFPNQNESPRYSRLLDASLSKNNSVISPVIPRPTKFLKQAWMDMLFVQSRQFLYSLNQIHRLILNPYYLANIVQNLRTMQSRFCCCHPSEKLQFELINKTVACISSIITQPFLNIEKLPCSAALRMIHNSKEWGGDIRLEGAMQIKNIWHDLGILKNRFSKTFFTIFAKLTTIPNSKIRLLAVECLFDIVHLDPENKKTELITQIDQAMENADSNSSYCKEMTKAFKQVLSSDHQYAENCQLVEHIIVQMNNIEECSHHLNDNSPINGMIVINNLREFYKSMGRSDIICRYLFKLMKIHNKIRNYTEMGYTLLELSSFYEWKTDIVQDTFLPPEYSECETEWELKAKFLEDSLKYFEKEDWEQGINVCKELALGYLNYVIDFLKLSEAYSKMAELLKKIMYEDRPESYMYIVFYCGNGFPKFITDLPQRSIVIRTKRNINEMSIDLNSQFQYTTVERKFPDENELKCSEKKIFYMPVKPFKFETPKKYEGGFVRQRILKYYENFTIREFVYKRLLNNTEEDPRKRKIDGCVIKCDEPLPNILSIVPVKVLEKIDVDPFLEALTDLENQIRKDEMLYQDYEVGNIEKRKSLYQKMKDVLIRYVSPVAGGVTKLVEMVPNTDEYLFNAGEIVTKVLRLMYKYLQTFEIYDNRENYDIFLFEFSKLSETVSTTLDIDNEEFNVNILLDQFLKSRKETRIVPTIRRPSNAVRIKTEDDTISTISRRNKHALEMRPEIISERWSNNPFEALVSQTESKESLSTRLPNSDSHGSIQSGPPLPPKPSRNKCDSFYRTDPPPKPRCDSNLSLFM